ncbi:NAD(P)H-dependent oxidoreductase [Gallaecimonas sp. GXIMD1310]|uniref:NAD(P)H-dependent oxidoreductase n=1 Tax=Gallaecimonas sp. GXIMD1310 TaxID=3131926 RepID=UPI00324CDFCC
MPRILMISGHPDLSRSHTNQRIIANTQAALPEMTVRCLEQLYPDGVIDVAAEQAALLAADVVVLQFPFYWYSVPALLKKWLDEVLSYGFAYGSEGTKLQGKSLQLSLTIGGPAEAYTALGYNHFSIEQLLRPLEQTSYLTGMHYAPPVFSHGMIYIPGVYNSLELVQARADDHAQRLVTQLQKLPAKQ